MPTAQRLGYGHVQPEQPRPSTSWRSYDWPGNIRELENVIHHTLLICHDGVIQQDDLRLSNLRIERPEGDSPQPGRHPPTPCLKARVSEAVRRRGTARCMKRSRRRCCAAAYRFCHYNQVHTANLLGLTRNVTRTRLIKIGELAVNRRRPTGATQGERVLNLSI